MNVDDPLAYVILSQREFSTPHIRELVEEKYGVSVTAKVINAIKSDLIFICEHCGVEFYPGAAKQPCCTMVCAAHYRNSRRRSAVRRKRSLLRPLFRRRCAAPG